MTAVLLGPHFAAAAMGRLSYILHSFLLADRNIDLRLRCMSPFHQALLSPKKGFLNVSPKSLKLRIRSPDCRSCSIHP